MDQRVAGGIGNLYATEALWRARIHPARKAREVAADPAAVSALVTGIRGALRHGLETYGASVAATPETEPPTYIEEGGENPFYVYDRTGEPCPRCGTEIESMTLGGRTSAYCPTCQPYKRPKRG